MRCRTDDTLRYVQFLARRFEKRNIRAIVLMILYDLGFDPSNEGFGYLRMAIEMQCAEMAFTVTKGIYPAISRIVDDGNSWKYIDQAIRRAINTAWKEREPEKWELFFPASGGRVPKCPSNKVFIARIACIIELCQSCKEAGDER